MQSNEIKNYFCSTKSQLKMYQKNQRNLLAPYGTCKGNKRGALIESAVSLSGAFLLTPNLNHYEKRNNARACTSAHEPR